MKYELETIPIWDTYEEDHECPLCILEQKAEQGYIDFYLGSSVMNPETRVEVNKKGFCPGHFSRLFASRKNRHGLGLISHTHMKARAASLEGIEKRLIARSRFGRGESLKKMAIDYSRLLASGNTSCMICDRLDYTLKRYTFTILYLWKKDDQGFRRKYSESKGFCTCHLPGILAMAPEVLSGSTYADWIKATVENQQKSMERLEKEIFWYTQKFDYQNNDKPWGTSKDALNRVIQKLTGIIQRDE